MEANGEKNKIQEQKLAMEVEETKKRIEIEKQKFASTAEEQMNKRVVKECAIMWMDLIKMDENERQYWELTRGDISAKFGGGGGSNGAVDGDGASV